VGSPPGTAPVRGPGGLFAGRTPASGGASGGSSGSGDSTAPQTGQQATGTRTDTTGGGGGGGHADGQQPHDHPPHLPATGTTQQPPATGTTAQPPAQAAPEPRDTPQSRKLEQQIAELRDKLKNVQDRLAGEGTPATESGLIHQQETLDLQIKELEAAAAHLRREAGANPETKATAPHISKEAGMAATATAELTYATFPIEKMEEEDGTLYVYGKATTPDVDSDEQVVDSSWSGSAMKTWFETGPNIRVQHNGQRDPAGSGVKIEIDRDGDGAHWVKAAIDEPIAQRLVKKGHLRAFSVGIAKPVIIRDVTGKARGGIIKGGELAEISLVDRPANRSCYVELAKAAADGHCEFTGKTIGADLLTKGEDTVNVDVPKSASITFSPGDLAKLLGHRRTAEDREQAALTPDVAKRDFDRNVGGGVDRDKIPDADFAGRNRSFPIVTPGDVSDALHSIGRAGADNYDANTLHANILRIARRKGFPVPDSAKKPKKKKEKSMGEPQVTVAEPEEVKGSKCATCNGTGKIRGGHVDCPDCDGGSAPSGGSSEKADLSASAPAGTEATKSDGGDGDAPQLHHDDGDDDDTDSDADAMDKGAAPEKTAVPDMAKKPKIPCPKCKGMNKAKAKFCGKCGTAMAAEKASKPTPGDGVTGEHTEPAPPHREPDGPAIESLEHDAGLPTTPDSSVKADEAMLVAARHKTVGADREMGMLHDLTCAAYDPAAVAKSYDGVDFSAINVATWLDKTLTLAASAPLEQAREAGRLVETAVTLKAIAPDLADELRHEAHKAFRDANPGPAHAPTPTEISAQRFNRPLITDGRAAPSPDQKPPNKAPIHPGHIAAADFHRDLITAGHAADSPDNDSARPEPVPAPEVPGVPSRVYYTRVQRQNAAQAMRSMHDHIAATFPDLCPMHGPGRMGEPPSHARPVPVGVGGPVPHGATKAAEPAPAGPDEFDRAEAEARAARKAAKKQRRELGDAILKGAISVEDAQRRLGLNPDTVMERVPVTKAASVQGEVVTPEASKAFDPDLIKSAVAEAQAPLLERLDAQQRLLDAMADQPDPRVAAYRGVALTKTSAPAGLLNNPERPAGVQDAAYRAMHDQWKHSPDPELRENALAFLMKHTGLSQNTKA